LLANRLINPIPRVADGATSFDRTLEIVIARQTMNIMHCSRRSNN
jgi:hypothetical protein